MALATAPVGWQADAPTELLIAYRESAPQGWPLPAGPDARDFLRSAFHAVPPHGPGLLTGYHEPELAASLARTDDFSHPLYAPPPDLAGGVWFTRTEIETQGLLDGQEIVWVASALDGFLAQVQGSVRARLADGSVLRLGHAGLNGHPYVSIGRELVRLGAVQENRMSIAEIRAWCRDNPGEVRDLLRVNPSYAFFRLVDLPADRGPLGTAGVPLVPMRSIAVDPDLVPLGAPVWVDAPGIAGFPRVVVAQDTGSAIRGPGRVDLFCGWGDAAAVRAGSLRVRCEVTVLVPRGGV